MDSIRLLTLAPSLSSMDRQESCKHIMSWTARTTCLIVGIPGAVNQPWMAKYLVSVYLLAELWCLARDLLGWWIRGREERTRLGYAVAKERLTSDNWGEFLDRLDYLAGRPLWNPFRDTDRSGPYIPEGTYR